MGISLELPGKRFIEGESTVTEHGSAKLLFVKRVLPKGFTASTIGEN